jgi:hypothetical protein
LAQPLIHRRFASAIVVALALAVSLSCQREPTDARPPRAAPPQLPTPPTPPPGHIVCGDKTCDAATTYCETIKTDVPALPSTFTCKPLPPSCRPDATTPPACTCFPRTTRCRNFCRHLATTAAPGFQLICVGGA